MGQPFLLEIGAEELPAGTISGAEIQLLNGISQLLDAERLSHAPCVGASTPRRLIVGCADIAESGVDAWEVVTGPKKEHAFDAQGQPTKAALGFAKSKRVDPSELFCVDKDKGTFVAARIKNQGRSALEVLSAGIPPLLLALSFPKSMRWGSGTTRFSRPVRWILCLLGDSIVPVEAHGLRSDRISWGHRTLGHGPFSVRRADFEAFQGQLREQGVLVPRSTRQQAILDQLRPFMGENSAPDPELLDRVTDTAEFPTVIQGSFDEKFLRLPSEILITTLKHHQRLFSVQDAQGRILPKFLGVMNASPKAEAAVRSGNERVVRARLEDARFFWDEDVKLPLSGHAIRLDKVLVQAEIGTYAAKCARLGQLVEIMARSLGWSERRIEDVRRAAALCKADLVTQMVGEFPELQGIVGGLYALQGGERIEVARAISEHYRPWGQDDEIPESLEAGLLSACDKADTLVGCFLGGLEPTGAGDPLQLRRAGMGLVRVSLGLDLPFRIRDLFSHSLGLYGKPVPEKLLDSLSEFIRDRVRHILAKDGMRKDLIEAALKSDSEDAPSWKRRAEALNAIQGTPGFEDAAIAFRRVANIAQQGLQRQEPIQSEPDPSLFQEQAERNLWAEFGDSQSGLEDLLRRKDFQKALNEMMRLKPSVDAFFDSVMVMVDDVQIRQNRLRLMWRMTETFRRIADFSEVTGS